MLGILRRASRGRKAETAEKVQKAAQKKARKVAQNLKEAQNALHEAKEKLDKDRRRLLNDSRREHGRYKMFGDILTALKASMGALEDTGTGSLKVPQEHRDRELKKVHSSHSDRRSDKAQSAEGAALRQSLSARRAAPDLFSREEDEYMRLRSEASESMLKNFGSHIARTKSQEKKDVILMDYIEKYTRGAIGLQSAEDKDKLFELVSYWSEATALQEQINHVYRHEAEDIQEKVDKKYNFDKHDPDELKKETKRIEGIRKQIKTLDRKTQQSVRKILKQQDHAMHKIRWMGEVLRGAGESWSPQNPSLGGTTAMNVAGMM